MIKFARLILEYFVHICINKAFRFYTLTYIQKHLTFNVFVVLPVAILLVVLKYVLAILIFLY